MNKMQEAWEAECKKFNLDPDFNPTWKAKFEAGYQAAIATLDIEQTQWRNIKHVVRTLADWAFESKDHPKWGVAWISIVNGLTAKDGPEFKVEPLLGSTTKETK